MLVKLFLGALLLALFWLAPGADGSRPTQLTDRAQAAESGLSDLVLTEVQVSPSTPAAGSKAAVWYTVRNDGGLESLTADVRAFLTPYGGGADQDLGNIGDILPLSPGRMVTQTGTITLGSVPAGSYLLRVHVDWSNTNAEPAEWNNSQVRLITVSPFVPTATPPPPPPATSTPQGGVRTSTPTGTPRTATPASGTATPTPGLGTPTITPAPGEGTPTATPTTVAASAFPGRLAYINSGSSGRELIVVNGAVPSAHQRLSDRVSSTSSPEWSPDGTRIAFGAVPESGPMAIRVSEAQGTNLAVIQQPTECDHPSWSPDSKRVAFTCASVSGAGRYDLFVADANGENLKQLTTTGVAGGQAAWSPDGARIAFSPAADFGLYVVKADGTDLARLSDLPGSSRGPHHWSPDGATILFWVKYFGDSSSGLGNISTRTYVVGVAGAQPLQLAGSHRHVLPFGWNRVGDKAYLHAGVPTGSSVSGSDPAGPEDVLEVARDGSLSSNLTNNAASDLLWGIGPDGKLFFRSDRDGTYELFTMERDGSNIRKLTDQGGRKEAAALSPSGTLVAFIAGSGEQSHVFLLGGAEAPFGQVSSELGTKSNLRWSPGVGPAAAPSAPTRNDE